jgi:hypothetical protein
MRLSNPTRSPFASPFADQASFLSRQGGLTSMSGGSALPTSGVSNSLLDSLSQPIELFERDSVRPAPAVGISSGATLGGAQPFDEFCQPEDFTCD